MTNRNAISYLIVFVHLHTPSHLRHSHFPRHHPPTHSRSLPALSLKCYRLLETDSSSAQTARTVCSVLCLRRVKVSVSKRKLYREFILYRPNPQPYLFILYKLDLTSAAAVYRVVGSPYAKQDVIYGNAGDEKPTYACDDLYAANVLYSCLCAKMPTQGHKFGPGAGVKSDPVSQSSGSHTNNSQKTNEINAYCVGGRELCSSCTLTLIMAGEGGEWRGGGVSTSGAANNGNLGQAANCELGAEEEEVAGEALRPNSD